LAWREIEQKTHLQMVFDTVDVTTMLQVAITYAHALKCIVAFSSPEDSEEGSGSSRVCMR
jgi:hypothetical protein